MLNLRGRLISLEYPLIMGVLNVTPDSFYDGGRYNSLSAAIDQTKKLLDEGADIIDIGAQSTRPYAKKLTANEEIERLKQILPELIKKFPDAFFSIDTYYGKVAAYAADRGVAMINDVSGGEWDEEMLPIVAKLKLPYVVTHSKGTPKDMQIQPEYDDVVHEVAYYFSNKILELHELGLNDIILDPGFGFGKTIDHNFQLINELEHFKIFQKPILVGISRKSFIYKILEKTPDDVLCSTMALHLKCLEKGASIIRTHDVAETKQVVQIFNKMKQVVSC